MMEQWFFSGWHKAPAVLLAVALTYIAILLYTRIVGLRSLSKMSAADFAMTVAVGSLFASTASMSTSSLAVGVVALAGIYLGQWILAWVRLKSKGVSRLVDNRPVLLMRGSQILDENLRLTNMTREDLFSKLREANVHNYQQVNAVVFETTGDVSVLHSDSPDVRLEPDIFHSVQDGHRLFSDGSDGTVPVKTD